VGGSSACATRARPDEWLTEEEAESGVERKVSVSAGRELLVYEVDEAGLMASRHIGRPMWDLRHCIWRGRRYI
jgi:hypothetical protein